MQNRSKISDHIKQWICFINRIAGVITRLAGIILFCFTCQANLFAQTSAPILFSVSKPTLNATNEELVDMVMKIQNKSSQPLDASASVTVAANLELVSKTETPFVLQPGDSMFIPVKIFVSKKAQSGRVYLINLFIHDKNNTVLVQARSQLRVTVQRNVNLFSMVSNILLDNTTDSLIIPVRIANAGNTAQKITMIINFPAVVQDQAFHASRQIILQPSADTLINFSKPVNRKMISSNGFNVTVTGLYENGDVAGMAYIRVQSARSNRNFRDMQGGDDYNDNTITLSSQSMFTPTQSFMLRGRGGLDLAGGKLGYNVDLTTWKAGYAPPLLQNTWIDYQKANMGIRAGNINRTLDINLSGRGASVFIDDTTSANRYEAGYIDGTNNLLGNSFNYLFPAGEAGWGVYTHYAKKWQFSSFAVYQNNPAMNSKDLIWGNNFNLVTTKNIRYTFSASAGHTSEFSNTSSHKFGMALSAGVTGTIGNISFNSANYFSSSYYPGIQRGALSFSERITWVRPTSSLWMNLDYYRYRPQILSSAQYMLPAFGMLRAEAGISGKINKLSVSAAPGYTRETSNAYQFGGTLNTMQSLSAWNVTTTLNYLIGTNQYLSVNNEVGFYSSSFDPAQRFHLRSNAVFRKGIFSLNTTLQLGTFYMGEAANNFVSKTPSTYTINIIPTVQKSFFRNKLRTEASVAYMNGGYFGSSWYLAGRVDYDVTSKTGFYASINHNRYAGYGSSIVEMGIIKRLPLPKAGAKTNSLELFVYKDLNRNGVYDATDSVAPGYMLYINNDIFMTASNGSILYKNLPADNYRLSMPVSSGWYSPERYIKLDKKTRVEIPLQRTGTVKGTISYRSNEFSYEVSNDRSGITVTATDSSNHIYKTKTGSDGRFVLYIPVGAYSLSLDRNSFPAEMEPVNDNQQVKIDPDNITVINFDMKIKSRKIETKKFVSPTIKNGNK
ncbi:MAG: carboxypeptidase-like regulatory domain-containing protein [Bacteroidota bacterium]